MSEYIGRESIRKSLMEVCSDENCPMFIAATIDQVIDYEPAADVAPVVHGRWVHSPSPYDKRDDFWFCSECGRTINIICGDKLLSNYPYCHCGAKMDGGDTDV